MAKRIFVTLIVFATLLTLITLVLPVNEKEWMGVACDSDSDSADLVFLVLFFATPLLTTGFLGHLYLFIKQRTKMIIAVMVFCLCLFAYHIAKWQELNAAYDCLNTPPPRGSNQL